jgi:ABC-type thiamine transport system ATPase subunit
MTTLYRVRDQLMSTTAAGQRYRALYDRNTVRISYLLLLDPSLRATGSHVLQQVTPGLNQLMDGRGDQTIVTREMVADATSFLQRLAEADRVRGGGGVAQTIEQEMARIDNNKLIGMTFKDAWAYINSRNAGSTIYLPMISK